MLTLFGFDMEDRSDFQSMIIENMARVKNVIIVVGGKGGVGKSTISASLAYALAAKEYKVGLLDADITGPNITKFFGLDGVKPEVLDDRIYPLEVYDIKIISMEPLLNYFSEPVAWRGPMVIKAIVNFLRDVVWGPLDYLIIDMPPGTGDELLTVMQVLPEITGALVVTTPQSIALMDATKSVELLNKMDVPVIGVVENMSYYICSSCGTKEEIFPRGNVDRFLKKYDLKLLGRLPLEPAIGRLTEEGMPFVTDNTSEAAEAFWKVVEVVEDYVRKKSED